MSRSKVFTALALVLAAQPVVADGVTEVAKDVVNFVIPTAQAVVPEPGIVPLLAIGAAVGIFLHWRCKRKK